MMLEIYSMTVVNAYSDILYKNMPKSFLNKYIKYYVPDALTTEEWVSIELVKCTPTDENWELVEDHIVLSEYGAKYIL